MASYENDCIQTATKECAEISVMFKSIWKKCLHNTDNDSDIFFKHKQAGFITEIQKCVRLEKLQNSGEILSIFCHID